MTLEAVEGFFFLRCSQIKILNGAPVAFTHYERTFSLFEDDDDDVGEDEDEDDGFFVPHGYLSEDEGVTEVRSEPGGDGCVELIAAAVGVVT